MALRKKGETLTSLQEAAIEYLYGALAKRPKRFVTSRRLTTRATIHALGCVRSFCRENGYDEAATQRAIGDTMDMYRLKLAATGEL